MIDRLRAISFMLVSLILLAGCRPTQIVITQIVASPTIAPLSPLYTMTPKYTATPIPSITPIPSATLPPTQTDVPVSPVPSITPTATASIECAIGFTSPTVNLRSGPGSTFSILASLKAGSKVFIIGQNTTKDWFNVRLEDGSKDGWLLADLASCPNSDTVPTLSTAWFDGLTQTAAAPTSAGAGSTSGPVPGGTRRPGVVSKSDVLAYCDNPKNGEPRKTIPQGAPVTVYWSWFAKTPEQLADHVLYATYKITIDDQELTDWRNFKTDVIRLADGNYYIFWYVPIGSPTPGEHKITYNLTWSQQITDGYKTYGPGGSQAVDNGSCVFTVK